MLFRYFTVFLIALTILAGTALAAEKQYMQVKVYIDSKDNLSRLYELGVDIAAPGDGYMEIVTWPDQLRQIEQLGFRTEVMREDMTAFYQSRLDPSKDMGGYPTLMEIEYWLDDLIYNHSNIVSSKLSLGQTIEGRDQWAVKISDNPNVDEDEPEVMYTAAIHAREVITPLVLMNVMDSLTDHYGSDPDLTYLVDNREMWFVLVVNPDGYYRNQVTDPGGGGMWRKNRRDNGDGTWGVDLNRNYGYQWGYDNEGSSPYGSSETYRGTAPFSEPETQNMRDFTIAHEFVFTIYFHSYSNLVLYPWGYDYLLTPHDALFSAIADSMAVFNSYAPGPAHGLYPANGVTDDWGYGEQTLKNMNLAYTFEVGSSYDGFWPSTSRIDDLVNENYWPVIRMTEWAENPYMIFAPSPPVIFVEDTVDSAVGYDVAWSSDDTLNPALVYELQELQGYTLTVDSAYDFDNWDNNGFSLSTTRLYSWPTSFYSGSGNNLQRYMDLTSPMTVEAGDTLRFQTWYDIENNWDYAYVDISTDGVNFSPIAGNITTTYNPNGNNRGAGITGSSGGWVEGIFDLSPWAGQTIQLRLSYYTDSYVEEEGFYVDDLFPVEGFDFETVISSSLTDTSYSFSEKPGGEYFYRVRGQDADEQWSGFSNLGRVFVVGEGGICYDSDNDGYGDPDHPENECLDDNCPDDFNPDQADGDEDGVGDVCDNCPAEPNADQVNSDTDEFGDACDNCPEDDNPDQADFDSDQVGDLCDNCVETPNADQANSDHDLWGDACDNCPEDNNDDQLDSDGDSIGDVCDVCPNDPDNDIDSDGYCADVDNCPGVYNPDQADTDGDQVGDACCCVARGDADHDGDLDISDLVFMVNYMFKQGPVPGCPEEGNVDGSGDEIDISDLVAVVNFMFKEGEAPPPCY